MRNRLFLIDCMAIVYRAHFAFARKPIINSKGRNTSALFGFTLALLDLLQNQTPTHLAAAFDTPAPTERHTLFPEYKGHREAMPEDLVDALPDIRRLIEAFRIPLLIQDGFEADDLIGTAAARLPEDFECYMVTPDKDFGQLVTDRVFLFKPSRGDSPAETWGVSQIRERWGIQQTSQVIDILGLMGDASDNIPGVPGIGEKTAAKLIADFGSVENLLANTASLKGKLKENLEAHRDMALLSKRLATIRCDAPLAFGFDEMRVQGPDPALLLPLFEELEFKSLTKRVQMLYGLSNSATAPAEASAPQASTSRTDSTGGGAGNAGEAQLELVSPTPLGTAASTPHRYRIADSRESKDELISHLRKLPSFCFDLETTGLDAKTCRPIGIAFSWEAHTGWYWPLPVESAPLQESLRELEPIFGQPGIEKVGHNLKFDVTVLRWNGVRIQGPFFDTLIAHTLLEPDQRHGMDDLAMSLLAYRPIPISTLIGEDGKTSMADAPLDKVAEYAAEDADVTWQLRQLMGEDLKKKDQTRVFYEVEMPLLPVLVEMEFAGVRIDITALEAFSRSLAQRMEALHGRVLALAGCEFNLNSPKQLGDVLFDKLKLSDKPKRTKTGQYATDESTLESLSHQHEIVRLIVEFRECAKLKSTYADALPLSVLPQTQRVHTTYNQAVTATGRLNSQNPNLQNIPIRSEQGQEIRRAFIARDNDHRLISADYSQIELRIIAAVSGDPAMIQAFRNEKDIHTATAAAVHGVMEPMVTSEMRRTAKMVNFGIIYGISAFGLAQRLGIPRSEAARIIENYFLLYPGVKAYMSRVVEEAREHGFVTTLTGRRRYLRDIRSANAAVRAAAERNAINTPIQGTAADLIKLAMSHIATEIEQRGLRSRMLLQVHDELLFEAPEGEVEIIQELAARRMRQALDLPVPLSVEVGVGRNWLEAHG